MLLLLPAVMDLNSVEVASFVEKREHIAFERLDAAKDYVGILGKAYALRFYAYHYNATKAAFAWNFATDPASAAAYLRRIIAIASDSGPVVHELLEMSFRTTATKDDRVVFMASSNKARVRKIGQGLHEAGGLTAMQLVYYGVSHCVTAPTAPRVCHYDALELQGAWDGIGDWSQ
jgi:hypothetical protein